ncbi:MAG: TraR/DksA C4-type zinc finger protein, partial [Ignavibacteriaceae bacterium]|nr:TraR/DksA C4-type zinc finger protein [Ignavibacteriaceae bacterium]
STIMTEKERRELKQSIIEKIKELKEKIDLMEKENKPVAPDNAYGRLSRMEAIGSKAISDAALGDMKVTLQRLGYALTICDSPGYGTCTKCNQEIMFARLMAIPYATLCINCAQKR